MNGQRRFRRASPHNVDYRLLSSRAIHRGERYDRSMHRIVEALKKLGAIVILGAVAVVAAPQQLEPSKIDVDRLGPQVGEIVPQFRLPDQHGRVWTRESIMGPRGAMLVFVRSAEW